MRPLFGNRWRTPPSSYWQRDDALRIPVCNSPLPTDEPSGVATEYKGTNPHRRQISDRAIAARLPHNSRQTSDVSTRMRTVFSHTAPVVA